MCNTYGRTTAVNAYEGALVAYTASNTTLKPPLNIEITEKSHFLTTDREDFYLGTPLVVSLEYMLISYAYFPPYLRLLRNLDVFSHHGHVMLLQLTTEAFAIRHSCPIVF